LEIGFSIQRGALTVEKRLAPMLRSMERDAASFVVWIETDPDRPSSGLRGRVEHLETSARASFASGEELLAFLTSDAARRIDSRSDSER
jgi:hypothetical protein